MNVPYTTKTGIKIGCRYGEQGSIAPLTDPDMQFIQEALLATPEYIKSKQRYNLVMLISTAVAAFVAFGMFLFN